MHKALSTFIAVIVLAIAISVAIYLFQIPNKISSFAGNIVPSITGQKPPTGSAVVQAASNATKFLDNLTKLASKYGIHINASNASQYIASGAYNETLFSNRTFQVPAVGYQKTGALQMGVYNMSFTVPYYGYVQINMTGISPINSTVATLISASHQGYNQYAPIIPLNSSSVNAAIPILNGTTKIEFGTISKTGATGKITIKYFSNYP
ncbi:MAG: hypothetical protein KGH60_04720 [Candidatus Micrarchaeota archaeon]|nr:hypothetical protein [Candidatus Micrarchaeota archaeon]